jgi:DNA-binding winged helix-turn-helix (wHTH) protein
MPLIVLERLTRTLIGPVGERVELPLLSLRLLDALAAVSPSFVGPDTLLQQVWPGTHIGADALKQRVRLLRRSLASAGYDPGLLDSVRGEGYALLATLGEPAVAQPDSRRTEPSKGRSVRRWMAAGPFSGAVALIVISLLLFRPISHRATAAPMGPSPVRVGVAVPTGSRIGDWLVSALAGHAHLLLVPITSETRGAEAPDCGTADQIHLCLRAMPSSEDSARMTLILSQSTTGAILARGEAGLADGPPAITPFVLQVAQFASPGVLRWIGGSTGAGDHAFTQFREGARLLGTCDVAAREDVIDGLRQATERSPNFHPGRAMLVVHEMESAVMRADTARARRVRRDAEMLVAISGDLALAHLAIARGAALEGHDSLARSAAARATRLQPVLGQLARSAERQCRQAVR